MTKTLTVRITGVVQGVGFRAWAEQQVPGIRYSLPPQTPIKTETMTVRLASLEERQHLLQAFARSSQM